MQTNKKQEWKCLIRDKVEFKVKALNEKKGGCFMVIKAIKKMQWSRSFRYQITSAVSVRR